VLSGSSHDAFNAGNITLVNRASTTLQLRALDNAFNPTGAKVTYLGTTQQLVLTGATLVPEPSVALLAAGAFAALSLQGVRRRRRTGMAQIARP
jgi:hypothetical protein